MISLDVARALRNAGLRWEPRDGDRFVVPDRGMDELVFTISTMTVDIRDVPGGPIIAFNGTVEWALDSVMQGEVLWLPREAQLRELLGDDFAQLTRVDGRYRCALSVKVDGEPVVGEHELAEEAYARALLRLLRARLRDELAEIRSPRPVPGRGD